MSSSQPAHPHGSHVGKMWEMVGWDDGGIYHGIDMVPMWGNMDAIARIGYDGGLKHGIHVGYPHKLHFGLGTFLFKFGL